MLWEPVVFITLGALAGIIPAIKAYRTDVARNLTPH
jgi:putative ABC transport system permease protein